MSYLEKVNLCNRWRPSRFAPLTVANTQVGWLTHERVEVLQSYSEVFAPAGGGIAFSYQLATAKARTAALKKIMPALAASGHFPEPRGELYAVKNRWSEKEFFRIDRGLVPAFGVRAYGVHVNGVVKKRDGLHLWIGTRATDRMIEPGKLDNMVAGGQPAGLSLMENVIKESAEEASIGARLAGTATPTSVITYACERDGGFRADTLFCYDLELPAAVKPKTSEEIIAYSLMPVEEALRIVRTTNRFKFNVALVIIDFAVRRGLITPDTEKDFETIVSGLHMYPQPVV
ncbi:MAG: DUF4743 domain-containing protein [Rhodospirillaceae bacterium]